MTGRWPTVVVDPPWAYEDQTFSRRARDSSYGCLSLEQIAALPVADWLEDNAHIYLWTTNGFMEQAHQVARAWGFEQKTIITWVKTGRIGLGHYFRNATEHALFCVRGRLGTLRDDLDNVIMAPRGRHSEKPDAFYDRVEQASPGPYLDVFARRRRLGWEAWGDEWYPVEGLPLAGTKGGT